MNEEQILEGWSDMKLNDMGDVMRSLSIKYGYALMKGAWP